MRIPATKPSQSERANLPRRTSTPSERSPTRSTRTSTMLPRTVIVPFFYPYPLCTRDLPPLFATASRDALPAPVTRGQCGKTNICAPIGKVIADCYVFIFYLLFFSAQSSRCFVTISCCKDVIMCATNRKERSAARAWSVLSIMCTAINRIVRCKIVWSCRALDDFWCCSRVFFFHFLKKKKKI